MSTIGSRWPPICGMQQRSLSYKIVSKHHLIYKPHSLFPLSLSLIKFMYKNICIQHFTWSMYTYTMSYLHAHTLIASWVDHVTCWPDCLLHRWSQKANYWLDDYHRETSNADQLMQPNGEHSTCVTQHHAKTYQSPEDTNHHHRNVTLKERRERERSPLSIIKEVKSTWISSSHLPPQFLFCAWELYLEPAGAEDHFVVSRDQSTSWNEEDKGHSHQNSCGVYIQVMDMTNEEGERERGRERERKRETHHVAWAAGT